MLAPYVSSCPVPCWWLTCLGIWSMRSCFLLNQTSKSVLNGSSSPECHQIGFHIAFRLRTFKPEMLGIEHETFCMPRGCLSSPFNTCLLFFPSCFPSGVALHLLDYFLNATPPSPPPGRNQWNHFSKLLFLMTSCLPGLYKPVCFVGDVCPHDV